MNRNRTVVSFLLICLASAAAAAPRVLPAARDVTALLPVGDRVYGGLADGGVVVWDAAATTTVRDRWTTADGLSGLRVTDLAWTGRHLWVATADGGLTRIDPAADPPVFRQVVNIVDLNTTAVAGGLRGEAEWVWFGTAGSGLGVVVNGLPGVTYTAAEDSGLVSDEIRCLVLRGDDLVVGTDSGVSLLADNLLRDWSGALAGQDVSDLLAAGDTVWVAVAGGVYRRAPGGDWEPVGNLGRPAARLALVDGRLTCLAATGGTGSRLWQWDGAAWRAVALPRDGALALAGGDRLRVAGGDLVVPDNFKARRAWLAAAADPWEVWEGEDLYFANVASAAYDAGGTLWLGSRMAAGIAWGDGTPWQHLVALAGSSPDSNGLFDTSGPVLGMAPAPDGALWFCQFQSGGLARFDPASGATLLLDRDNSGLADNRVVDVMVHPDGPVLALSDRRGVSVLVDPARPHDPAAWLVLDTGAGALGGATVRGAALLRRDRILFAVENVGIAVWDLNGLSGGPDDPLTWQDTADDLWGRLETAPGGAFYQPAATARVAVAPDGTFWAAGSSGVAHLRLTSFGGGSVSVTLLGEYHARQDPSLPGLMQEGVTDVAVAPDGTAWVCHDLGVESIRETAGGPVITAYTSVSDFFHAGLGVLYSPTIIAGLPPGKYRRLAVAPDGRWVLAAGENGAVLLDAVAAAGSETGLAAVRVYPNPFIPGRHQGLRVGGVSAPVQWGQYALTGGFAVTIYNLEGQIVYQEDHVPDGEPFWDGRNLRGEPAAPGTYVARIALEGRTAVRSFAVVR